MTAPTTPSPAATPSSHDTQFPTATILVVDDVPQNVELLLAYLETLNCTLHVAVDGIDALEKVPKVKPDLILLDIMMPRMSGFEVCRRLKADPKTRDIPILMVTALNELGDIERGVESGTDDFLTKPINKLELLTRVKSLLRVRQYKSELDRTLAYLDEIERRPSDQ
jgi:two-component system cell cycle response regulator